MQVVRLTSAALTERHSAFLASAGGSDFFAGWPWARLQMETCADPGDEIGLLTCLDEGGTPRLILPIRTPSAGRFMAGAREAAAFATPYSTVWRPLADAGFEASAALALCLGDLRRLWPGTDYFAFEGLSTEEPWLAALRTGLRRAGFLLHEYAHFGNWHRPTGGLTWERLQADLPSQLRNTLARKGKRLAAEHDASFSLLRRPDEAPVALAAYQQIYARSWKSSEPYPDFIGALVRAASEAGVLRLGLLKIDGQPAAAQIWIVSAGRATIFKLAHDEAWKAASPGSLLCAWMMQQVLAEDQPEEIDFGRGDDAYKQEWLPFRRERRGLVAFDPRRPRGLIGAMREYAGALARRATGGAQRSNQASG